MPDAVLHPDILARYTYELENESRSMGPAECVFHGLSLLARLSEASPWLRIPVTFLSGLLAAKLLRQESNM